MVATRLIFPEEAVLVQEPLEWAQLERLGEEVSQLVFRRDLVQPYVPVTVLDYLMSKVLADVNLLCPLPAAEDVIQPFDAGGVVLQHLRVVLLRESHVGEEVAEVYHFDGRLRD